MTKTVRTRQIICFGSCLILATPALAQEGDAPATPPAPNPNLEVCEGFHKDEAAALATYVANGKDLDNLKIVLQAERGERCITDATQASILEIAIFIRGDIERGHERRRGRRRR